MIYLIRTIENREGGSFEYRDNEYSGDEIAVGRATDQDIHLTEREVALQHAVIDLRGGGRGAIKARSSAGAVSVNGKVVRSSPLQPGDSVQIGESVLEVISAPTGFDFALTLERGEGYVDEAAAPPGSQYVTTLAATGLRKRLWSWVLFLFVVIAFFAVPASGLFDEVAVTLELNPPVAGGGRWIAMQSKSALADLRRRLAAREACLVELIRDAETLPPAVDLVVVYRLEDELTLGRDGVDRVRLWVYDPHRGGTPASLRLTLAEDGVQAVEWPADQSERPSVKALRLVRLEAVEPPPPGWRRWCRAAHPWGVFWWLKRVCLLALTHKRDGA